MPVAIITGADSGIGEATAVALAGDGYDVGITYRSDEDGARETAAKVEAAGRRAVVRHLDLSTPASGADVVDDLAGELGGIDAMINNAGTGSSAPFLEMALDDWQRVIDVDLTGAFVAGQAAARRMVGQGRGGVIVNVTSIHETLPLPESAPYCAAKGGLGLLTKVMALELGAHGIRVVSVAPGQIATPMTGMHDRDPSERPLPNLPLRRPGHAREIAATIAFLCSPGAGYATGSSFLVDGGMALIAAVHGNQGG
ncbi:MAG TPA: SDR family oxidoreductase [Miltoncostaeaceae bacterium]|nr:SDR family oxidoreductase [Miltoncostaeaceae bacterium]